MKKSNYTFLMHYLKKDRFLVATSLTLTLVNCLLLLAIPYLVGLSIDLMIGASLVNIDQVIRLIVSIGLISLVVSISQYFISYLNNLVSFKVSQRIRDDLFLHLNHLPLKYLDGNEIGDITNKVINDVDIISDGLIMGFNQFFSSLVNILTCLIVMFVLNYQIALVVFFLTPVSLLLARFISSSTFKLFKKQSEERSEQSAFLVEMITNQKVVEELNLKDVNRIKFEQMNDELEKTSIKATFFSSLVNPTTRLINAMIYSLVALVGALVIVDNGALKVGLLVTFLAYVNQYTKPFNELTGVISEIQNAFASIARVSLLLEEAEEDTQGDKKISTIKGDVTFDRVYFSYTKDQKLIEDLNLSIKSGTKVALIGPTGSGKTTIINLLMRFYEPTQGRILIDNQDLKSLNRESFRDQVGMVLQDTYLKNASIYENVKIGKEEASEEEVITALKKVHAYDFVEKLEEGIHTIIKEDTLLSNGQKQLLALARVMLVNAPLLILDEATSSLDIRSEKQIQDAFNLLMENKTTFIVAHRLSTIVNSDLILVLKDGKVIEKGTHQDLIAKKGFYYSLYNSQFN